MLSRTGEYALRAVVFLTEHGTDVPVSGPTIAKGTGIPAKYLSSILGTLVRQGVLAATRGKKGGFQFTREPRDIPLQEVILPFESRMDDDGPQCPFGLKKCSEVNPCAGHHRWKIVRDAYDRFLCDTTLADVASDKKSTLLKIIPVPG